MAKERIDLFFDELAYALETAFETFPDQLDVRAVSPDLPSLPSYPFEGVLSDADFEWSLSTLGTMDKASGDFEMLPISLDSQFDDLEVMDSASFDLSMLGSMSQGQGQIDAHFEAFIVDPRSDESWGCIASSLVDFNLRSAE